MSQGSTPAPSVAGDIPTSGRSLGFWALATCAAVGVATAVFTALSLPPRVVTISAAWEGSPYTRAAERYRAALATHGLGANIVHSRGGAENVDRLRDPASGVDIAFSSVGFANADDAKDLASLGAIFVSPIWMFYRDDRPQDRLAAFAGKRIAIGAPGSSITATTRAMLAASGIRAGDAELVETTEGDGIDRLARGELDLIMFPGTADGLGVARALALPGVRLLDAAQAAALAVRVPGLRAVTLARGAVSTERDLPSSDVRMLAVANCVLIRRNLHPSLQFLVLEAMRATHEPATAMAGFREYPAPQAGDLPLSEVAEAYYRGQKPFLVSHLPFWVGALLDQAWRVLLPLLVVLLPILRLAPTVYRWSRMRPLWQGYVVLDQANRLLERPTADGAALERARALLMHGKALVVPVAVPHNLTTISHEISSHKWMLDSRLDDALKEVDKREKPEAPAKQPP